MGAGVWCVQWDVCINFSDTHLYVVPAKLLELKETLVQDKDTMPKVLHRVNPPGFSDVMEANISTEIQVQTGQNVDAILSM